MAACPVTPFPFQVPVRASSSAHGTGQSLRCHEVVPHTTAAGTPLPSPAPSSPCLSTSATAKRGEGCEARGHHHHLLHHLHHLSVRVCTRLVPPIRDLPSSTFILPSHSSPRPQPSFPFRQCVASPPSAFVTSSRAGHCARSLASRRLDWTAVQCTAPTSPNAAPHIRPTTVDDATGPLLVSLSKVRHGWAAATNHEFSGQTGRRTGQALIERRGDPRCRSR